MDQKIMIRSMTEQELHTVMGWAAKEKWNPGRYDNKAYFSFDKAGYFLLLLDDKPVGAISAVQYSEEFSFIGLFIVLPEYRAKGLGKMLWKTALTHLEKCHTMGLYAVPQQISRYQASGFNPSYSNQRWASKSPDKAEDITHLMRFANNYLPTLFKQQLSNYDRSLFQQDREKLLNSLFSLPQAFACISSNTEGNINGYGLVRPCEEGFRVGPVYADDFESATKLCRLLLAKIPGESIILDIPTTNTFGQMFAEYFNLTRISAADTVAMFKGEEPQKMIKNTSKCFAVASLELG